MAENKLAEKVENRVNRELDTRAKDERPRTWKYLPDFRPEARSNCRIGNWLGTHCLKGRNEDLVFES